MRVLVGDITLIFLILLLMVPGVISESGPLRVINAEGVKIGSMEILERQGARYVELLAVTKLFEGKVRSDPLLKRMTVTIRDNDIVLNIDRTYLTVNDVEYVISNPPINMAGRIAVPLEFLTEILPKVAGKQIVLDREKWTLQVDVKSSKVSIDEKQREGQQIDRTTEITETKIDAFKVILDPGHGGTDTGATSESGVLEKDLTLLIAQKMRDILKQDESLDVYLTRNSDDYVSLEDRASFANRLRANLFLSIHFNWSFSKNSRGFRIFVNSDQVRMGTGSEFGQALSKFRQEKVETSERLKYLPKSRNLAKEIADHLQNINLTGQYNSEASLSVMDRLSMPGVLVEVLYLSNSEDMAFISGEESIDLLSQALCDSVLAYVSKYGN